MVASLTSGGRGHRQLNGRQWALKLRQAFANQVRRRLPAAGDKWHMDEVMLTISGVKHWLWRAIDQTGMVLDILVQSRRDMRAARREVMPSVEHRKHKGLNNRAENSHQPTRQRERQMKRLKSAGQAQRLLSVHDGINNLFHLHRHRVPATQHRAAWTQAYQVWAEVTGVAAWA